MNEAKLIRIVDYSLSLGYNLIKQQDGIQKNAKGQLSIAEQCREVGFTKELTKQLINLQPKGFRGNLYSYEYWKNSRMDPTVEKNPQEKRMSSYALTEYPYSNVLK